MNKPLAELMSAPVRSRPDLSTEEIRGDKKLTPPDPPLHTVGIEADPIPLEVRRFRVQALGSKRKRDLATVRVADELARLEATAEVALTPESQLAWVNSVFHLRLSVPESTFNLWLRDLSLIGVQGETVVLDAPVDKRSWIERRYSTLILEALKAADGRYTEVSFVGVPSCR